MARLLYLSRRTAETRMSYLWCFKSGANIAKKASRLWTPLHYAAYGGWEAVVDILLQNGADPTVETDEGKRAQALANAQSMAL
jgi:ankyrin repeat protein